MDTDATPAVILSPETCLNGSSQMAGHSIALPSALGYITMIMREFLYDRDLHAPGNGRTNVSGLSFGVSWGSPGNGRLYRWELSFFFFFTVAGAGAEAGAGIGTNFAAPPSSSDDDATGDAGGVLFTTRRRFFFFLDGASESDDEDDDDEDEDDEDEEDDELSLSSPSLPNTAFIAAAAAAGSGSGSGSGVVGADA